MDYIRLWPTIQQGIVRIKVVEDCTGQESAERKEHVGKDHEGK